MGHHSLSVGQTLRLLDTCLHTMTPLQSYTVYTALYSVVYYTQLYSSYSIQRCTITLWPIAAQRDSQQPPPAPAEWHREPVIVLGREPRVEHAHALVDWRCEALIHLTY